jgi:hypothetical protein
MPWHSTGRCKILNCRPARYLNVELSFTALGARRRVGMLLVPFLCLFLHYVPCELRGTADPPDIDTISARHALCTHPVKKVCPPRTLVRQNFDRNLPFSVNLPSQLHSVRPESAPAALPESTRLRQPRACVNILKCKVSTVKLTSTMNCMTEPDLEHHLPIDGCSMQTCMPSAIWFLDKIGIFWTHSTVVRLVHRADYQNAS